MKKKDYVNPQMEIVEIKSRIMMFTGSDEGGEGNGTGDPTEEEGD